MKRFIYLSTVLSLMVSMPALSHEGHHGEQSKLIGKYGGILAAVSEKSAHKHDHHDHSDPVYKAELVRATDRTVRIYLYDNHMKPLPINKFEAKATAKLIVKKKGEALTKMPFALTAEKKNFRGVAPKPSRKPFNIEITFKEKGKELLVLFENLD